MTVIRSVTQQNRRSKETILILWIQLVSDTVLMTIDQWNKLIVCVNQWNWTIDFLRHFSSLVFLYPDSLTLWNINVGRLLRAPWSVWPLAIGFTLWVCNGHRWPILKCRTQLHRSLPQCTAPTPHHWNSEIPSGSVDNLLIRLKSLHSWGFFLVTDVTAAK